MISIKAPFIMAQSRDQHTEERCVGSCVACACGRAHRLGMFICIPPKAILPSRVNPAYSLAR